MVNVLEGKGYVVTTEAEKAMKNQASEEVDRLNTAFDFESKIENFADRVFKRTSAKISTEEDVAKAKAEIEKNFGKILNDISANELLRADQKEALKEKVQEREKSCKYFVDKKFEETPAKLYFYSTGGKVSVKANINQSSYSYHKGKGKKVRFNRNDDRDEYPLIVSVNYIDEFLSLNGVRDQDILIDPRSVDTFYGFDNVISTNLTPSFVYDWYNHDCPYLYRYEVNKEGYENFFGLQPTLFSTILVESSWSDVYVDEDMTEEEANKLMKGYEHTRISKEIQNVLKANKLKKDRAKIEEIESYVRNVDAKVQAVIDEYTPLILEKIADKFGAVKDEDGTITIIDDQFGLDLGFVNIYTTDKKYTENRSILSNVISSTPKWMELKFPYPSYSTTVLKEQFNMFKDIVYEKTGFELYAVTQLD